MLQSLSTIAVRIFLFSALLARTSAIENQDLPICNSLKCACDYSTKTVTCRGLVFEYLPLFPDWTETLDLNSNHLTLLKDNAFDRLINLKRLRMSWIGLEYIEAGAFKYLSELTFLDLSHNHLYYWPSETFRPLRSLKTLNLSGNAFDDITIFTKLLPLDNNQFDELILGENRYVRKNADFVRLPQTKRLDLSGSKFSAISGRSIVLEKSANLTVRMDALAQADYLTLYGCGAVLDASFFDSIRNAIELNIGDNKIVDLKVLMSKFGSFPRIESFNASRLASADGDVVTWNIFPPFLKLLDLSYLNIFQISFDNLITNNQLSILHLSYNQIQTIRLPSKLPRLRRIRLDGNQLTSFPAFESGARFELVEHLDLSDNLITNIDSHSLNAFSNLRQLFLAHNRIVTVHPAAFSECCLRSLHVLDLSHNSVEILPTLILWSLIDSDLSSNRLRRISNGTLARSTNLEKLDLSYNSELMTAGRIFHCDGYVIRDVPVQYSGDRSCALASIWIDELVSMPKLKQLTARGVGLSSMPAGPFSRLLSRLEHLDLSENLITTDQWESLASILSPKFCIRTLKLRRNRLTALRNLTLFKSDCLERLDLKENPFDCDCTLEPIYSVLKSLPDSEREVNNESAYYCFSPSNYYRYPLYDFASNLQPCSYFESSQSTASAGGLRIILGTFLGLVAVVLMAVFCRACLGSAIRYSFNLRQRMYKPLRVIISRSNSGSELASPIML